MKWPLVGIAFIYLRLRNADIFETFRAFAGEDSCMFAYKVKHVIMYI